MTQEINLTTIAEQFTAQGQVINIQSLGNGNINDTFLVILGLAQPKHFVKHFVLQRINTQVFRQPQLVMENMRILTNHIGDRLQRNPAPRRWEVPRVLLTTDGQDLWQDDYGGYWRAISFVENAESFDNLPHSSSAVEVGYALGMFHNLISDLPPAQLADTLPGFHITPVYVQEYQQILATAKPRSCPEVNYCLKFCLSQLPSGFVNILEDAKATGKLPLRLMHGDPKINNVLFDTATQKAVSLIDLDTVKPGLVHYDIGDCLRSGCNLAGEDAQQWEKVYFDTDLCQGILQGYLDVAQAFFTDNDYAYIYPAIALIAFELGLRFFTDYLAGNVYFKVKYPEHNLARALVQFKLTQSIQAQQTRINQIVQDLRGCLGCGNGVKD